MAQFFFKKHSEERSEIAKKNIFYSFFVKGFGIFISLLVVPVTIKFLNPTEYGIWLTLNSILLWINTFDIGLGNGLRNKLSEAFADNDLIAIGTIKALKLRGFCIPEDIAVVGFDNISEGRIIDPALTTISIPRHYMGEVAARELLSQIEESKQHTCKIEVSAKLVKRFSV